MEKVVYLTPSMLCRESGLDSADLQRLEEVGLLRPTHVDPALYRPKLLGWARKLAFLLDKGWTLTEIKQWSHERWAWPNPRLWPPSKSMLMDTPSSRGYPKKEI